MSSLSLRAVRLIVLAAVTWLACVGAGKPAKPVTAAAVGVDPATLSAHVNNPYAPWSLLRRAVWDGWELDDETKDTLRVRVEMTVLDAPETVAGTSATVAEFVVRENGVVAERSWEYYAQDPSGAVFQLGRKVDDIEEGKVVGHVGQWMAGEKRARAGLHMPTKPALGSVFEQGLAPGASESRSKVTKLGLAHSVPAGDCEDCLETDVLDPVSKDRSVRVYCRDKGRVKDQSSMHSLQLVELELRTPPPQPNGK